MRAAPALTSQPPAVKFAPCEPQAPLLYAGMMVPQVMDPRESNSHSNDKQPIETKPVKEILEPAAFVETKVSVESALDELKTQGSDSTPVTDPEGTLVGNVSKHQMYRGVGGRGHDPKTSLVEPEVKKEGEPYCYENETIAKAEEVMRAVKVDQVSVVSEEKKLLGKATLDAIEKEKKKG